MEDRLDYGLEAFKVLMEKAKELDLISRGSKGPLRLDTADRDAIGALICKTIRTAYRIRSFAFKLDQEARKKFVAKGTYDELVRLGHNPQSWAWHQSGMRDIYGDDPVRPDGYSPRVGSTQDRHLCRVPWWKQAIARGEKFNPDGSMI